MPLLTVKEVSDILRKSQYTVRYRMLGYEIPYVIVGSSKMVEREDLEKYIRRNKTMKV